MSVKERRRVCERHLAHRGEPGLYCMPSTLALDNDQYVSILDGSFSNIQSADIICHQRFFSSPWYMHFLAGDDDDEILSR
jgi:hypothetical protein